jgi:hypothetical protein
VLAFAVLAVVASLVTAPAAEAQETVSWIAFEKTKPGKSRDLIGMTLKEDAPMYDELMKNGTLMAWGIAIPIHHRPDDDWNYVLWATMSDWSKVGGLQAGFEKSFASRTPEQMAAMQQAFMDATVAGSHHDWVVNGLVYRVSPTAPAPRYLYVGFHQALPGKDGAVTDFYTKHVAPIYEKLLAEGVISGYGLDVQALHGEPGWSHYGWYTMADLGAMDTVSKALESGLGEARMAEAAAIMDRAKHSDRLMLIVHMGGMPTGN